MSNLQNRADATSELAPPRVKELANIWLIAAHNVLQALDLLPSSPLGAPVADLYVHPTGKLYALEQGAKAPEETVYVCALRPGIELVVVAARLRQAVSRWRPEAVTAAGGD